MQSLRTVQGAVLAAALSAGFAAPTFAGVALPQPVHTRNVTYISGGIGLGEQQALEAQAKNYDLAITNANKAGDFTTGTRLVIAGKKGRDVLRVAGTGPLFYAKLPPGDYTIRAMNDGQYRTRAVKISAGTTTDVHLIWPQMG
jgi:hypothetical protein